MHKGAELQRSEKKECVVAFLSGNRDLTLHIPFRAILQLHLPPLAPLLVGVPFCPLAGCTFDCDAAITSVTVNWIAVVKRIKAARKAIQVSTFTTRRAGARSYTSVTAVSVTRVTRIKTTRANATPPLAELLLSATPLFPLCPVVSALAS